MMLDAAATVSPWPTPARAGATPAEAALTAFVQMVQGTAGFRVRPGQEAMARQSLTGCRTWTWANTLSPASHRGDPGWHRRRQIGGVCLDHAGAGAGPQDPAGDSSTATVALQEQLMTKDLPALAAVMPVPFVFALAKGRGRYVRQAQARAIDRWRHR